MIRKICSITDSDLIKNVISLSDICTKWPNTHGVSCHSGANILASVS